MFVLIWAALLFSVRGSNADTGSSAWGQQPCYGDYCVTLSEQELTAEAGLCVLIPCSFRTAAGFTPKHIVWFKCEASTERCSDADIIFHSNKNTDKKSQTGFEGRVSRLEPDVSQNNCSIIINDLKASDSGSYQFRVTGDLNGKEDGFTFIKRVTVSVKGLIQKPTVTIPTLTEGQQATLTCTAPGLCSGSVPEITWTWRGAGGTESHITDNITAFKTENLTAFTQIHISTLTFDPSAKYHNTNVTCKIHFTDQTATEQTSALNVNYVKEVNITGVTSVREGEGLNLTCSVESFPPALVMWSKLGSNTNLHNDPGSASLIIQNVTAEHSGLYVCTAKYMNNTMKDKVSITVIYLKKPQIIGNTAVKEGDVLNLTCRVESFPLAVIVWKKIISNTNLHNETDIDLHNDTGSATLVIPNVTAEHSGQYICTVKHLDTTVTLCTNVTVNYLRTPQIIGNTAVKEGDVLNLTCSVQSFPPALIVWKELSFNTNLHNDTGSASLIIQNVTAEHSGQYVCTAKYMNNTLKLEVNLTVIYNRTPQIIGNTTIKEGDDLNLTCSVESFPPSLIVWKQLGSNTNLLSDSGSASLIIQNVTAKHSGLYICTAKYMNNTMKDEVNITVIYKRTPQIIGNTTVREGDDLNVTCRVESFPPSLIVWKNHSSNTDHNDTGSSTFVIRNVTAKHSGQYICTAKHLDTTVTLYTNVTVNYVRTSQVTGNKTVKKGDDLNLTCSVESVPPALIVWKKKFSNTNLHNETDIDLHNDTGSAALVIRNVTTEHSGQYICTVKHLDTTVTLYIEVIVTWFSKILDGSGCVLQSEGLTCVCISEGFPLPTINWPLLKHHTEYSVITTVSNHTVNSTVRLTVKNHGNTNVDCVSNNGNGDAKENLLIHKNLSEKHVPLSTEQSSGFRLGYLKIIIAFLTGVLLSATICLAKNYYRKKQKNSENSDQTSEMETRRDDKLVYYGQALQHHLILNSSGQPTELVYADIDFSLLKINPAREATRRQESTKTEYAEIKKALKEEWENDAVEDEEIVYAKEEQLMVELEMKQCEPENKEGGDEAVYATVNDITDDI